MKSLMLKDFYTVGRSARPMVVFLLLFALIFIPADKSTGYLYYLCLCAVRLFSSTRIAGIRGQSDRNIRKVRGTMFKKIRKKLLAALTDKAEKQQPMTLLEKEFLRECRLTVDNGTKKQYNR